MFLIHDCQDSSASGSAKTENVEDLLTLFQINYQEGTDWIDELKEDETCEVVSSPCGRYEIERVINVKEHFDIDEIQMFDSLEWSLRLSF